jgi:hypothetical protein
MLNKKYGYNFRQIPSTWTFETHDLPENGFIFVSRYKEGNVPTYLGPLKRINLDLWATSIIEMYFFYWFYSSLWVLASYFQFHYHFTDGRTPWMWDQLVARPLLKHKTTHTNTKYPCLMWDPNPRSRLPSERRQYMPQTARLPWPAIKMYLVSENFC